MRILHGVVLSLAACRAPAVVPAEAGATFVGFGSAPPPAASATATVTDPVTTYRALGDAQRDGAKAFGRSLSMRAWRGTSDDKTATLHVCNDGTGTSADDVVVTYPPAMRNLVRAMSTQAPPGQACGAASDGCSRVVVLLRGTTSGGALAGELDAVLDVAPMERRQAGADYASLDDADLDGAAAFGRVARIRVHRTDLEADLFFAHPCEPSLHALSVHFVAGQRHEAETLSTSPLHCQPVDVKLRSRSRDGGTWEADLIAIGR